MLDIIERLETTFGYDSLRMVLKKPTIIIDRGIATMANIEILKNYGYPYVVITHEDQC